MDVFNYDCIPYFFVIKGSRMPELYIPLSPCVVVAGTVVFSAASGLVRELINAGNTNQSYPVDTTKRARFNAVPDDEVAVTDKAQMDRIISDAIEDLVRANIAIKKIKVSADCPVAVADLNTVTKYNNAKDYIERGAGVSLSSLLGDLLEAALLVDKYINYMKNSYISTTSEKELSLIDSAIQKDIDLIRPEYLKNKHAADKIKQYSFA